MELLLSLSDSARDLTAELNRPLLVSMTHNDTDLVKIVLQYGADPIFGDVKLLYPIFTAFPNKNLEILDLIICKVDVNVRNEDGNTPLMKALWLEDINVIEHLVYAGVCLIFHVTPCSWNFDFQSGRVSHSSYIGFIINYRKIFI